MQMLARTVTETVIKHVARIATLLAVTCLTIAASMGCAAPSRVIIAEPVVVPVSPPAQPAPRKASFASDPAPVPPVAATTTNPAAASIQEDVDNFYRELAPYGDWVDVEEVGLCWRLHDCPAGWRPYTLGHWVFTDECGWFWVSDEPFGWCCYHYGRWTFAPSVGWCWIPGRVWGGAWVAWRSGAGYIGWAALPPARGGVDASVQIGIDVVEPPYWAFAFVNEQSICEELLYERIIPVTRNVTVFSMTVDITHYDLVNGRFINRGVDVRAIEKITGRPVRHFRLEEVAHLGAAGVRGDRIGVYRPLRTARRPVAEDHPRAMFVAEPPRERAAAEIEADRRAIEERHRLLAAEMEARHQFELRQPRTDLSREQVLARQQRELGAFEEMRKRELEVMRQQHRVRTLRRQE